MLPHELFSYSLGKDFRSANKDISRKRYEYRGDSNEYTQYTIFHIKMKITLNYSKSAAMGFFQRT